MQQTAQELVKSPRPSNAYMRQQTRELLVQIMDCYLLGAMQFEAVLVYRNVLPLETNVNNMRREKLEESRFENVICKLSTILSRPRCSELYK